MDLTEKIRVRTHEVLCIEIIILTHKRIIMKLILIGFRE